MNSSVIDQEINTPDTFRKKAIATNAFQYSNEDGHALAFLKLLDPNSRDFCFRTFDDVKIESNGVYTKRGDKSLARKINSSLKEALPTLRDLNAQGAGAYVVINAGGQSDAEITSVRAVYADTDGAPLEPLLTLKPHMVVESSKDKWHVYWLVSDCSLNQFSAIQTAIACKYGTDPAIKNLSRVMRLAGFNHNKYGAYPSKIITYNHDLPKYTISEVRSGLGLDLNNSTRLSELESIPTASKLDLPTYLIPFERLGADRTATIEPYPFTPEQAIEFLEVGLVAYPNIQDFDVFREWGLSCASLIKAQKWAEDETKRIFDAVCDNAPNANKADNDKHWQSFLDSTEHALKDGKPILTHLSVYKKARANGWKPTTIKNESVIERMNIEYAWIDAEASIYRITYRDFISTEKFNNAHANQFTTDSGNKPITVSKKWMSDANRRHHQGIVTRPNEPEVTKDGFLNNWKGYAVASLQGDIAPFKKLYTYLFGEEKYPLLWIAHLVQHSGVKMYPSLVVWSTAEGVGKNLLFEAVQNLFPPEHATVISQSEVEDDFSGWIAGTVFAIADEIKAARSDKVRDRLKIWATATTLRTHDKGQPKRVVPNLLNLVFLSNHADGIHLTDNDRRFFIWEVTAKPLPQSMIDEFVRWRDSGGLSHLLHHLQRINIAGFDPKGRAPMTQAKFDMVEASRSDLERWCKDVVTGSISLGQEITCAERLLNAFCRDYPNMKTPPSVSFVGKTIARLGAYTRKNQVRLSSGRKIRAIAVNRTDYWENQNESAWRDEFEGKNSSASAVAENASP